MSELGDISCQAISDESCHIARQIIDIDLVAAGRYCAVMALSSDNVTRRLSVGTDDELGDLCLDMRSRFSDEDIAREGLRFIIPTPEHLARLKRVQLSALDVLIEGDIYPRFA